MERLRIKRLCALLVVSTLVVAACGSDSGERDTASDDEVSESETEFPVTIEHKFGSTTIDEVPERVVVVGLTEQDALLALGVVPVATTEWFGEYDGAIWPWAQDEVEALDGEIPDSLGDASAYNFEAAAAQAPDLIVGLYAGLTESDYEKFSQIAPTIAQPGEDYAISWDEMALTVGAAVGKSSEARTLVDAVQQEFAGVRAEHPEFEGASAVVATPYEGIFLYGPEDPRGRFLTSLGFDLPPDLEEVTGTEFGGQLSVERAEYLDLDTVVWLDYGDAAGTGEAELYESLPVHTEGREVLLDSFDDPLGGATSFVTVLSLPFLIDGIVPKLAAAVDGDPTTEA